MSQITQETIANYKDDIVYAKWLHNEKDYTISQISDTLNLDPDIIKAFLDFNGMNYQPHQESLCIFCSKCCNSRLCNRNPEDKLTECEDFERGRADNTGEIETEGALRLLETLLNEVFETYIDMRRIDDDKSANALRRNVLSSDLFKMCGVTKHSFKEAYNRYLRGLGWTKKET